MAHVVDTQHHGSNGSASGRGALALVTALTVVGAAAAFFLLARAPGAHGPAPHPVAPPVATWMKVACADAPRPNAALLSCPRTSTLRLGIEPMAGKRSLALALLPPDGLLIWSFPDESGRSAKLDDGNFSVVEIPLDAAMTPGVTQIFALRSEAPLTRPSVRKRIEDAMNGGPAATQEDLVAARVLVLP